MLDTDHEALSASLQSVSDPETFAESFCRLAAGAGYRAWAMAEMTRTGEGGHVFEVLATSHAGAVRRSYACRSTEKGARLVSRTWRAKAPLKWRVVTDGTQPQESCVHLHAHLAGSPARNCWSFRSNPSIRRAEASVSPYRPTSSAGPTT